MNAPIAQALLSESEDVRNIDLFHGILNSVTTSPEAWPWVTKKDEEASAVVAASAAAGNSSRPRGRAHFGIRPSDEAGSSDHVAVASVTENSPAGTEETLQVTLGAAKDSGD